MAHKTQREQVFDYIAKNQGTTAEGTIEDLTKSMNPSTAQRYIKSLIAHGLVRSVGAGMALYPEVTRYVHQYTHHTQKAVDLPQTPEQAVDTILSTLNIKTAAILRHKLNEMFQ
jgi:DNA-binding IclR family transcriptional regulator